MTDFPDSMQHPTEQSEKFWSQLEKENETLPENYVWPEAFNGCGGKPSKRMTDDEVGTLWERISRQVAMEKRVKRKKTVAFLTCGRDCCLHISVGIEQLLCFSLISFYEESSCYSLAGISEPDSSNDIQLILSEGRKLVMDGKKAGCTTRKVVR